MYFEHSVPGTQKLQTVITTLNSCEILKRVINNIETQGADPPPFSSKHREGRYKYFEKVKDH